MAPPPDPRRTAFLKARPFAHRGLHRQGVPENSMSAFRAAIAKGCGIELDVRAGRDGEPMVFHDAMLDRLTAEKGPVGSRTAAELSRIRLGNGPDTIPTLSAVLALVNGETPILIEIKAPGLSAHGLCFRVRRTLEGYRGDVAIMSFNPEVPRWFAGHAPRIVRGLVVSEEGKGRWRGRIERQMSVWRATPDFLAYDVRSLPSRFAARQRARGLPILSWTVRTGEEERRAMAHADEIIFEANA